MTTKQHTPGPWSDAPGFHPYERHILSGGGLIARVGVGVEGGAANACVIAAAPDLLYALANVTEFMQQALAGTIHQDNVEFFGAMARTAMAKARGEA
jgi:hypothetical protein